MTVRLTTLLPLSADATWATLKRPDTLRYLLRGVLGFRTDAPLPGEWLVDADVWMRLWFFHVLPGWRHMIRFLQIDDATHEIRTTERGGMIKSWRHRMVVETVSANECRYTDEIDIDAGLATPLVATYAWCMYCYRHHRWRRLARKLASAANATSESHSRAARAARD